MAKNNKKSSAKPKKAAEEIKDITTAEEIAEVPELTDDAAEEAVEEVVEDSADVEDVVEDSADVEDVAEDSADVEEVVEDSADVEDVAEDSADVEDVVEDSADVEEVAEDSADVEEVAEDSADVEEVAEDSFVVEEDVEDSADVEAVAEDSADVEEVAEDSFVVEEDVEDSADVEEVTEDSFVVEEDVEDSADVEEDVEDSFVVEEFAEISFDEENVAEDSADEDIFEFIDENDDNAPMEAINFENGIDEDVVDLFAEAAAAEDVDDEKESEDSEAYDEANEDDEEVEEAASDLDTVDEDDYLDYDDDDKPKRPKKLVSGKTAVLTLLFTVVAMIAVTTGIFCFLTYFQKDTGLSLVSYTDRFNACDTNSFGYASMLGLDDVSYSDAETTLSQDDISALKSGKTVTKFDGLAEIKADVRFGNIVSMDFKFSQDIDSSTSPSVYYMLLAGNVLSGFTDDVLSSDYGFMMAYSVLNYATVSEDNENIYSYQMGDVKFYIDYTEAIETGLLSDLTIHVESADPHYIDWSEVDTSWLPWNNESASDVSDSDK